jgi:predicted RNA-binding Zn-ribbon protein involved in translation (DUF1610 family)
MPKARRLDVADWQRECPECGYQNGFHLSFHRIASDEQGNNVEVRLICPSCSTVYEIGLRCRLAAAR